jgi:transcriptional regulator with XRE-family HTH domain
MTARQRRGSIHALRKLLWEELDRKGWTPADLARASSLSPQLISTLLNDPRDVMDQMPKRETLSKIAYGFRIPESVVFRAAAVAWGVPVDGKPDDRLTADDLSNEELLATIGRRLGVVASGRAELRAAHEPSRTARRR